MSLAWHDRRVLHLVWYGLLAILLAAGLFALAARFLPAGEQIAPPLRDEPPWELPPDGSLNAEEIDTVRLPVALRGYRFAETDLLDRRPRSSGSATTRSRGCAVERRPSPSNCRPSWSRWPPRRRSRRCWVLRAAALRRAVG